MTDVVAQSGRNLVARKNLRRLLNGQETKEMWLDDEVINCYFGHLMARANANRDLSKLYCFTSHFFESACPDLWARKEKLFDMNVILIPVIVNKSHWVLVSVFPSKKTIIFYDSMYGCGFEVLMKILQIFEKRFQKETGHLPIGDEWSLKDERSIPRQSNSFDCGVLVCQMAERLSRQSVFDFN